MMFSNKFVAAIKVDGKILRELKDSVYIPYGSEYSILLKNLESRKASVSVSIDGVDVGEGVVFVVDPNSELELKRFVKNKNLTEGNAFKFIERTEQIEEHRGVKLEDGLLRVEFQFEKEKPKVEEVHTHHYHHYDSYWNAWPKGIYYGNTTTMGGAGGLTGSSAGGGGGLRSIKSAVGGGGGSVTSSSSWAGSGANNICQNNVNFNDAGITVPGSVTAQQFSIASYFELEEQKHVLVFKLLGKMAKKAVKAAITVKAKQKCTTCGRVNKATAKFCAECGTSLEIV